VLHSHPRALATELASICDGSCDTVLHCRLLYIDVQSDAAGAGAGGATTAAAEVDALGALVVDDVVGLAVDDVDLVVDDVDFVVDDVVGLAVVDRVVDDVDLVVADVDLDVDDDVGVEGCPMLALMARDAAQPPPRVDAMVPKSEAEESRL